MRLIPVMDVMARQVVRGVAGRRAEYRPIVSTLTRSTDPADVAQAFRDRFGFRELYVADLDAIAGGEPAWSMYSTLLDRGFHLWVDAGIRDLTRSYALRAIGVSNVIVALETLQRPKHLEQFKWQLGSEQLVFSLDLKGGLPLGNLADWGDTDPFSIASGAITLGARRLILLDLAYVGTGSGPPQHVLRLSQQLREAYGHLANLELVLGGGIRGIEDVRRLEQFGVSAVLVASALHDGRLRPEDLMR